MSAIAITTPRPRPVTETPYCDCGVTLQTRYERRNAKCFECERHDARMECVVCEDAYWSCSID